VGGTVRGFATAELRRGVNYFPYVALTTPT
jgi:hypothetical protein